MGTSLKSTANFCARLALAVVFVFAAASKLLDTQRFAQRIGDFGLVFDLWVEPVAWAIVGAEVVIGIALVFRWRGSLVAASGILLLFIGVLTYGTVLGLDIDCGCFGPAVQVSLRTQLLVDCGLLSLCAIIYFTNEPRGDVRLGAEVSSTPTQNESP